MPGTKPIVRASVLMGFDTFLTERGVDAEALYLKAGLPAPGAIDPEQDLSANAVANLMDEAAHAAKDPCIGLSWAEAYPFGGTGIIAYLFMNSSTVGEAMSTVARYVALLRQPLTVHYQCDSEGATLWWRWPDSLSAPVSQYGSFAMALLLLRMRSVIDPKWTPVEVELQGEPLKCPKKARHIFGPNAKFQSERNAVRVSAATLSLPMPEADPRLKPILQKLGEQMIAEVPATGDIAGEVRNAILDLLPEGRASLDDIATHLGMTGRTLQVRLAAQGSTSYETVLNDTLKARAEQLLKTTDLPMTEISIQLGFSELSSFTRAAQRWFKCTPSAKRKQLKAK